MNEEYNENNEIKVEVDDSFDPGTGLLEIKIESWLKSGWNLFCEDWLKLSVSVLISFVISAASFGILAGPIFVGLFSCFMKKVKGADFEYSDLFDGVKNQFLPSFVLTFAFIVIISLLGVIFCVGYFLAVAFMIIAAPVFAYSLLIISQEPDTVEIDSLLKLCKKVFEKIKPKYFVFVLWTFILGAIGGLGFVACCVGIFATYTIAILAFVVSYSHVFDSQKS